MDAKLSAMGCHGIPRFRPRPSVLIRVHPRLSAVKFAFAEAAMAAARAVFRQSLRIQLRMNADKSGCARAATAVWPMMAKGGRLGR
jgi:hypothetical protein